MINLLLSTELKNLWREKLITWVVVISCACATFAFFSGFNHSQQQHQVIQQAQIEQTMAINKAAEGLEERLLKTKDIKWWQDQYDLRGQAFYLMVNYASKPPLPTSPIATGQSDVLPYFFKMLVKEKQNIIHQYDYQHPLKLMLGQFDLSFVIIYILPLLIIAVCFNALSQERQQGQLRLMLLQGANIKTLINMQILLRASLVVGPFLIISTFLLVTQQIGISLSQIVSYILIVISYTVFWLAISVWVISKGRTVANNAAKLMTIWLMLVIVLPAAINTSINQLYPTPSRLHYLDELRHSADEAKKASEKTLAAFFQDHPELANQNKPADFALKKIASINAIEKSMAHLDQVFEQAKNTQQTFADNFKFLSPATLVQAQLVSLAGNDLLRHHVFMKNVERHHSELQVFFSSEIAKANENNDFSPCSGCSANATLQDLSTVPQFDSKFKTQTINLWSILALFILSLSIWLYSQKQIVRIAQPQQSGVLV
jgi:ABC-2 type transport system permease protein